MAPHFIVGVHPETAPFGPELRFYIFEILEIVHYSFGFKNTHAFRLRLTASTGQVL